MPVRITDNTEQVKSEVSNKLSLVIRLMLEDIHRQSLPYTPKQHGNLRADVVKRVHRNSGTITWEKNYAKYQEAGRTHGSVIRRYTTPGTGPHFARNAVRKVVKNSSLYFRRVGL